jgi:hypothetical protein
MRWPKGSSSGSAGLPAPAADDRLAGLGDLDEIGLRLGQRASESTLKPSSVDRACREQVAPILRRNWPSVLRCRRTAGFCDRNAVADDRVSVAGILLPAPGAGRRMIR